MFQIAIVVSLINKKKLDLRGASHPPSILIRRRPSNAGRETPRTPALSDLGSGAISWNRYPGRDRYPLGRETVMPGRARLTTQPKLSEAQRGGFFPQAGKFAPVGVRTPHLWSAVGCFAPLRLTTLGSLVKQFHTGLSVFFVLEIPSCELTKSQWFMLAF